MTQECQPESNDLSGEEKPAARDAAASVTAADWVESKARARVKVVDPLAATGICATWTMCPAVDADEYVGVSAWLLVSWLLPSLGLSTYRGVVWLKPVDAGSALNTESLEA